ncbi:MAG: ribulokinase [Caldithrix sp. RBG_13_44_9]|nr:MAG: ribulokinase [Caldithrix sp. RBG_13_44_9]
MEKYYSLGIDFGTNSVRTLVVDLQTGEEIATESIDYRSGEHGILLDRRQPHLARQHPGDYAVSLKKAVRLTMEKVLESGISPTEIRGIGIDGTGSSPLPVDETLTPLALQKKFHHNLNAQTWLWKDHTAADEAREITELAAELHPEYLKKCGEAYSSEWFFSKIFHCYRIDRDVFDAAHSWIELSDYLPALLCGHKNINQLKRNVCAAGHKAMFNETWGGLPSEDFLRKLSPDLAQLRKRLYQKAYSSDEIAGFLTKEWSENLQLPEGIPVAVGALDAHFGAVGSGVGKGILIKIIGTSTCDIMVYPDDGKLQDIPGVAGIVRGSVLPGYLGIEAGQSAVGDIFNWFVTQVLNREADYHQILSEKASQLKAGESGLLALDWNNGNRNILTDPHLSGLLLGQTLLTSDYEIYRALIEATAFGARRIIEQMEQYGVKIEKVINCGGIAEKNPLVMQIYADALGRPMETARSAQTVALGAAIFGGLVGLKNVKGFETVEKIQDRVCKVKDKIYYPRKDQQKIYDQLYTLYKKIHDGFGIATNQENMYRIMKNLLEIKKSTTMA